MLQIVLAIIRSGNYSHETICASAQSSAHSNVSNQLKAMKKMLLPLIAILILSHAATAFSKVTNAPPGGVLANAVRATSSPSKPKISTETTKDKPFSPFAEITARGTRATFTKQEIRLENDGAVADYGLQKVYFPADITESPIVIITPDGRKLQCRATFLALLDNATGKSVLLGQVRKSEGQLVGDNSVIYPNAFESINADIRFRYTKYSLEQDIILKETPKIPAEFETGNVRLEVWSEWIDSQPDKKETQTIDLRPLEANSKQTAVASADEQLKFGATRISDGYAFTLGNEADKTPVAKQFVRVEGRDWLIERVDYTAIRANLDKLPKSQASLSPSQIKTDRTGLVKSLQAQAAPKSKNKIRRMAMAYPASRDSVVLDFVIVSSVPVPADVISWWPAGGNAEDAGTGNDGTWDGTAAFASGKVGQGFSLGGVDNAVIVAETPTLDFEENQDFSIEAWIKGEANDNPYGIMSIIGKRDPGGYGYELFLYGGALGFQIGSWDYGPVNTILTTDLRDGNFHHVAVTVDRDDPNGGKLYVDGVPHYFDPTDNIGDLSNDEPLRIGVHPESVIGYFKGIIDEPAIFERALSESEILSIFNAGPAGKINPNCIAPATNIFAWWSGDGNRYDLARTNHVTPLNGATYESAVVLQGFNFDGSSSHARLADKPEFRFTDALTIEAWVNPTDVSWFDQMVDKWDAVVGPDQRSYSSGLLPGGQFFFIVDPDGTGSGATYVATTNAVEVGGWSHVAGTYDGEKLKVYLNGVLEAELDYTNGIFAGTNDMAIGGLVGGLSVGDAYSLFPGSIDEPTIYTRALTNSEITALYTAGSAGKCKVDFDADGLNDLQEGFLGTDPNDSDTDNDGLTDGDEVFVLYSNPLSPDADGDGVPDWVELAQGRNPSSPSLPGAVADTDGATRLNVHTPLK